MHNTGYADILQTVATSDGRSLEKTPLPNPGAVRTSASAVLNERAKLPCDVTSQLTNDRPVLILWYRDNAGTPIYSFDARKTEVDDGTHWSDTRLLNQRAYFQFLPSVPWQSHHNTKVFSSSSSSSSSSGSSLSSSSSSSSSGEPFPPVSDHGSYSPNAHSLQSISYSQHSQGAGGTSSRSSSSYSPSMSVTSYASFSPQPSEANSMGAQLELHPVEDRDQAVYRCRVDFLLSPTKNTIINFTVIIPPHPPEVYNETDQLVGGGGAGAAIIGPYNEGQALLLYCHVAGGRPLPTVRWLMDDVPVDSKLTHLPGEVVKSSLLLPNLTRQHLHSVLECQATNSNTSLPLSTTVTLDMNFEPVNVSIVSGSSSLSAGGIYELVCQAWGSRPAAAISWWKGGTQQLTDAQLSITPDNNITTSILQYGAGMTDNQKYLTCRAENTLIPGSTKEDGLKLNILYKPVATLQMGSSLDPENIKEGDDVYFECHINANPDVQRVNWYRNGSPVNHEVGRGIIQQNQTLVLQKVSKESAGLYTCRATNSEGSGESQPVRLNVLYGPYCKRHAKTIYGTALHEPASVTCELEANPGPVVFRWTFNNTSEHLPIPASAVISKDFTSVASYAPKSHLDYGTLLCWAFNTIGAQITPCAFSIIPAGPPDPPRNCSIANQTTDTIDVVCGGGFDGGLPQLFHMEVYESQSGKLYRNLTSQRPVFRMTSMQPGLPFTMHAYAANAKGRSSLAKLETFTLKVAEKRTGPPSFIEFTPVLGILVGIILAIILTVLIIMLVMKLRRPTDPQRGVNIAMPLEEEKDLENRPLNSGLMAVRVKEQGGGGGASVNGGSGRGGASINGGGVGGGGNTGGSSGGGGVVGGSALGLVGDVCGEDNDPDVIPHKADALPFVSYSSIERRRRGSREEEGDDRPPNPPNTDRGVTCPPSSLDGFSAVRSLPRQPRNSEDLPHPYASPLRSANPLSYLALDLPGLTETAPPTGHVGDTHAEEDTFQRGYDRQVPTLMHHQRVPSQEQLMSQLQHQQYGFYERRSPYGELKFPLQQPPHPGSSMEGNVLSTMQDQEPNFSERQFSDKFMLIKQQQLLIQEKQEQLKQLKEQRRRSLMGSPNLFGKSSTSDALTSGEMNSLAHNSPGKADKKTSDLPKGYMSYSPNHVKQTNNLTQGGPFDDDYLFSNEPGGYPETNVMMSISDHEVLCDQNPSMAHSRSYHSFSNPPTGQPTDHDIYAYATLKPRRNVYSSIPDPNSDLRTSTVVPLLVRQNESIV